MNLQHFHAHNFDLSADEISQFTKFLDLFIAYNAHTNLSAIRDEEGIVEKHFVDSLYGASILMEHNALKLLDIGSGGGFPGIPLKLVLPELDITLLDSVGKKVKAMNHFIEELGLQNIRALQDRAEVLAKNNDFAAKYDVVVSRATAYMTDILTWSLPFLKPNGKILLYKMPTEDEKKDMLKTIKKLGLNLEGELYYDLGGKKRVIYVFGKKDKR